MYPLEEASGVVAPTVRALSPNPFCAGTDRIPFFGREGRLGGWPPPPPCFLRFCVFERFLQVVFVEHVRRRLGEKRLLLSNPCYFNFRNLDALVLSTG